MKCDICGSDAAWDPLDHVYVCEIDCQGHTTSREKRTVIVLKMSALIDDGTVREWLESEGRDPDVSDDVLVEAAWEMADRWPKQSWSKSVSSWVEE